MRFGLIFSHIGEPEEVVEFDEKIDTVYINASNLKDAELKLKEWWANGCEGLEFHYRKVTSAKRIK